MKTRYFMVAFIALGLLAISTAPGLAQETTIKNMDEYRAQLADWQKREVDAKSAITEETAKIADLKKQIAGLESEIASVKKEMYTIVGADEAQVSNFAKDLEGLRENTRRLQGLSEDEVSQRYAEVQAIEDKLKEYKKNPISCLPEMKAKIAEIESMLDRLPKLPGTYTVVRGDCLYKISGYPQIYDNPGRWPRIYRANRDQISNPTLIYPNQVLKIPRGYPNTHTVGSGEWLGKIAGYWEIYGDWRKWTRIYEANRDQIKDPDVIYPNQVLSIPRN